MPLFHFTKRLRLYPHFGYFLFLLFFTGCSLPNLKKDVNLAQEEIDQLWVIPRLGKEEVPTTTSLTWDEAHALMIERNLTLLRSSQSLYRAKNSISRVYKDLIPVIDLNMSFTEMIKNLEDLEWEDLRLDARGNFFIPGILQLSENLYSRNLSYLRTEAKHHSQYRQLFLTLASYFERQRILRSQAPLGNLLQSIEVDATRQIDLEEFDELDLSLRKLNQEISQFFALPYQEWELVGDPPSIRLEAEDILFEEKENWGRLQRKEVALDLAAVAARVEGVKFDYWPDVSTTLSGASLYRRENGRTTYWDPGEMSFTMRARMTIDLNQRIGDNLKLARVDYFVAERDIEAGIAEVGYRLAAAQQDLQEERKEQKKVQRELQLVRELLQENALPADESTLRLIVNTLRDSETTEARVREIESTLIFFYDKFWENFPTPKPIDFTTYDLPKTILEK